MSNRVESNYYNPKSPFGRALSELGLKKRDIIVFSKMYGKTDKDAAKELISMRFDGREIVERRGLGWYDEPRTPRSQAAREVFVDYFGKPLAKTERNVITRAKRKK